jgi:predicted alpha-1,6-mannanase (GH76 family)
MTLRSRYKNACTNELVVANAAVLHRATGQPRYLQQAITQWQWFNRSGMINQRTGVICDGLSKSCTGSGQTSYTYNQGIILGGLAEIYRATADSTLLRAAHLIANGTMAFYTTQDGILRETGNIHDRDGALFKGIFVRNLRLLAEVAPEAAESARYLAFINSNAASLQKRAQTPDGL